MLLHTAAVLLPLFVGHALGQMNFTESNGQIFTPGFAVVDSPQPGTPLGGGWFAPYCPLELDADRYAEQIEIALDVTANGILALNVADDSPSRINNITIFMYSYTTGRNFTVSNGTATNGTVGVIMDQEPGSTVKHVKWTWPSCLAGDGQPTTADSARGNYNISIRQNFRLNNTDFYTIFDLPISVTNSIENSTARPDCSSLQNPLLTPDQINMSSANAMGILFAPGDSKSVQVTLNDSDPSDGGRGIGGAARLSNSESIVKVLGTAVFLAAAFLA